MFDLTENIKLKPDLQKKYITARIFLYTAFIVGALFMADRVLLPSVSFIFAFNAPKSIKNTLITPRINVTQNLDGTNGSIDAKDTLSFNAVSRGIFSNAEVTFTTKDNIQGSNISMRKSYLAFFYPVGQSKGFGDGALITTNGKYYLVSDGLLRKFANTDIILQLGYRKDAFLEVKPEDLQLNKFGEEISDANSYPNDTLFVIDENYYQQKDQQLLPFVSARAYLSRFDALQAIPKTATFFSEHPIQETPIGFADGTLASADISVYILSEGKSYPIANPETFVSMGYNWDDVIALDSDEISIYEQQKQFNDNQPHPNGTIFKDKATDQYFIIENGYKKPINSAVVVKTFSKQKTILADSAALENKVTCSLEKTGSSSYSCSTALSGIRENIGNNYQIDTDFIANAEITNIDTTFSSLITWENVRNSLSAIKAKLISNYIPKP